MIFLLIHNTELGETTEQPRSGWLSRASNAEVSSTKPLSPRLNSRQSTRWAPGTLRDPMDYAKKASAGFMVASGGVLSEGYGHSGPGVCLGDGQTEAYLKDIGMTGLASAWAMARRRTKEYRHKVDAATRCSGVCPHT